MAVATKHTGKKVPIRHAHSFKEEPGEPDHDAVARLAQSYWESRKGEGGTPEEDWYRAEEELRRREQ